MNHEDTLKAIAEHFSGCDLSDDQGSMWIVQLAAKSLGWIVTTDEYNQVKYLKGTVKL